MKSFDVGSKGSAAATQPLPAAETATKWRRGLLLGVGVVGAAALAAKALPVAPTKVATATQPKPTPDESGGYQETQHVLRYYETTRV